MLDTSKSLLSFSSASFLSPSVVEETNTFITCHNFVVSFTAAVVCSCHFRALIVLHSFNLGCFWRQVVHFNFHQLNHTNKNCHNFEFDWRLAKMAKSLCKRLAFVITAMVRNTVGNSFDWQQFTEIVQSSTYIVISLIFQGHDGAHHCNSRDRRWEPIEYQR